jgi:hypothetical protein
MQTVLGGENYRQVCHYGEESWFEPETTQSEYQNTLQLNGQRADDIIPNEYFEIWNS